jgi:amidase
MEPFASASDVAAAIRTREVSPLEVLEHYLAQVDRLDPHLNAFTLRDDDRARSDARAAGEALLANPPEDLSPLHGVPIPIKDLYDVQGWPTSNGSRAGSDEPAPQDDLPVARLRRAGMVFMGKTTTPELGAISCTESMRFGPSRNPWDPDRTPGGSSGGAAAAVASGMAPIAHASDGGGSIRIPASCTGLVGLKASRNRITGRVEKLTAAATHGVVSRTVTDTAVALDVLSEFDPGAWNVAPPPARPYAQEVGEDPGRLRVRICVDNVLGVPVDRSCREAVERTAALLADLGHDVSEGAPEWPDPGDFLSGFLTVWNTSSAGERLTDPALLEPHNLADRAQALATDSIAFVESVEMLQRVSRVFTAQFGRDLDVLVTPTMAVEPPEVGSVWAGMEDDPTAPVTNCIPMAVYTAMYNVTGLPALSLPLHVAPSGLPVGVQFGAPPFRDDLLIRLGSQLEAAAPWVDRRPATS